jgi:hypothetical protein
MFECDLSTTTRNLLADNILRTLEVNVSDNNEIEKFISIYLKEV